MSFYRYAAYGSNLHPLRLARRVSSAKQLGVSFIPGFDMKFNKRSYVDGSAKCNICVGAPGVHVAIFEIATSQKSVLDRIEGLGKGYNEYTFQDSRFGTCLTYVADPDAIDASLKPTDWYREIVLLGCRSNNFPSEYVRKIESIDAIQDPDEERRREQWRLVEELRKWTG